MIEKPSSVEPNQVERLLEIQRRLEFLSEQDKIILSAISSDASAIIDAIKISADNYILPRKVFESLEKLQELKFISEVEIKQKQSSHKVLAINQNGLDALILTHLTK